MRGCGFAAASRCDCRCSPKQLPRHPLSPHYKAKPGTGVSRESRGSCPSAAAAPAAHSQLGRCSAAPQEAAPGTQGRTRDSREQEKLPCPFRLAWHYLPQPPPAPCGLPSSALSPLPLTSPLCNSSTPSFSEIK